MRRQRVHWTGNNKGTVRIATIIRRAHAWSSAETCTRFRMSLKPWQQEESNPRRNDDNKRNNVENLPAGTLNILKQFQRNRPVCIPRSCTTSSLGNTIRIRSFREYFINGCARIRSLRDRSSTRNRREASKKISNFYRGTRRVSSFQKSTLLLRAEA